MHRIKTIKKKVITLSIYPHPRFIKDLMQNASIAICAAIANVQSSVNGIAAQGEGPRTRHGVPQLLKALERADTQPPNPRL